MWYKMESMWKGKIFQDFVNEELWSSGMLHLAIPRRSSKCSVQYSVIIYFASLRSPFEVVDSVGKYWLAQGYIERFKANQGFDS